MDELRERIAWIWAAYHDTNEIIPTDGGAENMRTLGDEYRELADQVLAAIPSTGFELVPQELLADLIRGIIATHGCHNCAEDAGAMFDYAELGEMLARLDS
jgi:hypothetical protein